MSDPYALLGIDKTATPEQVKSAYRRLAKDLHPDHSRGDKAKEARFKEVAAAYAVLSDPEKRQKYDRDAAGGEIPYFDVARDVTKEWGQRGVAFAATEVQRHIETSTAKKGPTVKKAGAAAILAVDALKDFGLEAIRTKLDSILPKGGPRHGKG